MECPEAHRNIPTFAIAAMNGPRNRQSGPPFFDRCCENGTKIEAFGSRSLSWSTGPELDLLQYRREDPTGARHIRAIAVAKGLQHHSLFPCDSAKEQDPETAQAREAGDPIREQQRLGDSPQPKCRIHRMSNSAVNPFRHKFMILPYVETDGPIPSERTMGQVKHAQRCNRKEKSEPGQQGMKAVSCETR